MNLRAYRRITQVLFILLIFLMPVLDLLRYDTATRELIVFGQVWSLGLKQGFYADQSASGAFHIAIQFFLKAILPWLFILSIFPLLGFFTGRFFCGWLCPEGALFELADYLTLKLTGSRSLYTRKQNDPTAKMYNTVIPRLARGIQKTLACPVKPDNDKRVKVKHKIIYGFCTIVLMIIVPLLGGIALTGYFVAPKTIQTQIINWNFTLGVKAGIIGVAVYMLTTSIFVRHVLCKFVCAAGLMQMLFGWVSPVSLRLKMDSARPDECTNCKGCEKACFMNVMPRKNKLDISCVNCGACIEACNKELGYGKGLFHYSLGEKCASPYENCKSLTRIPPYPLQKEQRTAKIEL